MDVTKCTVFSVILLLVGKLKKIEKRTRADDQGTFPYRLG
jgi:hypothetical protein